MHDTTSTHPAGNLAIIGLDCGGRAYLGLPHKQEFKMTDQHVCVPCGIQFLTEEQKREGGVHTAVRGICCLCGSLTTVLPTRHYNYLTKPKCETTKKS
jgi:hypothetical protein